MIHHALSQREEQLATTVARRLRVLTLEQIAKGWFEGVTSKAKVSVRKLEKENLLDSFTELTGKLLTFEAPLVIWEPYQGKAPRFSEIAYQAKKRWIGVPKRNRVYFATTAAINRYAGFTCGKPPATNSVNHDLNVSELYLHFFATDVRRTRRFIGEDEWVAMGHCGHKTAVPDAVIRNRRDYRRNIMIELAGQYSPRRLRHFFDQYQGFHIEVW